LARSLFEPKALANIKGVLVNATVSDRFAGGADGFGHLQQYSQSKHHRCQGLRNTKRRRFSFVNQADPPEKLPSGAACNAQLVSDAIF
jgi:hypothetical protein